MPKQLLKLHNGHEIPALGLGTWQSTEGEAYDAIRCAIKLGYRHIDCASVYNNEAEIGDALKDAITEGDVTREELFITSKLWCDAHAAKDVKPTIEGSLQHLKLDYLDLYLMHWPVALKHGIHIPSTIDEMIPLSKLPLTETWHAMEKLVDDNLVKSIGISNFNIKNTSEILDAATIKPAILQIEAHPYLQQAELFNYCTQNDIIVTAYSPLGSPGRNAVFTPQESSPELLDNPVIKEIAEKHDVSSAQILIAWNLNRGSAAIPKSTKPDRLKNNFAARNITLDQDDLKRIAELDLHYRYCTGDFFNTGPGSIYTAETIWGE